jgi:hypothetical protein
MPAHACRAALWHGSLQPSEALMLAMTHTGAVLPAPAGDSDGGRGVPAAASEAHTQLFELRAHFEAQEAYFEQYMHSVAAELRRMLLDPALQPGVPQYLPFLAILAVAAAQLVKSLVQSLEQLLPAREMRSVVRPPPPLPRMHGFPRGGGLCLQRMRAAPSATPPHAWVSAARNPIPAPPSASLARFLSIRTPTRRRHA